MLTARLIGGAGTGKTTELLAIMEKVIETGIVSSPQSIGFVSFTRTARQVAADRAAQKFKVSSSILQNKGWFRTLHSICFKCLGIKKDQMLTDNTESRTWMNDALGEEVFVPDVLQQDFVSDSTPRVITQAEQAITLWHAARNRMEPLDVTWSRAHILSEHNFVGKHLAIEFIKKYEQKKREQERYDFTDLLARYVGTDFMPGIYEDCQPEGELPALKVWFFDEQQDTSALLDRVCKRLVSAPTVEWVYTVGDPFQSIFGFAGSESKHFMGWDVDKERAMPKSWRCARPILQLGEEILRPCEDYFDRKIAAADHSGAIEHCLQRASVNNLLDDKGTWLVLARARHLVRDLQKIVQSTGIPWTNMNGVGGWAAPVRTSALFTLIALEAGTPIAGSDWRNVLTANFGSKMKTGIPCSNKTHGTFLERGVKTRFKDKDYVKQFQFVPLEQLDRMGASQLLIDLIRSGKWRSLIPGGEQFVEAANKYGEDRIRNPRIRVGTIHSSKGEEADNVILLVRSTRRVGVACQKRKYIHDEERRLAYVGVTRARKRLVLLHDPEMPYVLPIPGVSASSRKGLWELKR